jgi:hypothetical protein
MLDSRSLSSLIRTTRKMTSTSSSPNGTARTAATNSGCSCFYTRGKSADNIAGIGDTNESIDVLVQTRTQPPCTDSGQFGGSDGRSLQGFGFLRIRPDERNCQNQND